MVSLSEDKDPILNKSLLDIAKSTVLPGCCTCTCGCANTLKRCNHVLMGSILCESLHNSIHLLRTCSSCLMIHSRLFRIVQYLSRLVLGDKFVFCVFHLISLSTFEKLQSCLIIVVPLRMIRRANAQNPTNVVIVILRVLYLILIFAVIFRTSVPWLAGSSSVNFHRLNLVLWIP